MAAMIKTALTAMCVLLLLATGYLSLSLIVLNPPRANFPVWFTLAAIFTVQSVLALAAVRMERPPAGLRLVVAAGACLLIGIAIWRVRATLNSAHVEGYNLLLGAMLVVQGALTLAALLGSPRGLRYRNA
jgi:hypothetical protein